MKDFKTMTGLSPFVFGEYNLKCFTGVALGYLLYKSFPAMSGQFLWVLLSILLSITHDNSSRVAIERMKGNVIGSLVGLLTYLLHRPPNLFTICLGVSIAITICSFLKLAAVYRTALVAFVIVVLYEESHATWTEAIYRVSSVVAGCLIGLAINFGSSAIVLRFFPAGVSTGAEPVEPRDAE